MGRPNELLNLALNTALTSPAAEQKEHLEGQNGKCELTVLEPRAPQNAKAKGEPPLTDAYEPRWVRRG